MADLVVAGAGMAGLAAAAEARRLGAEALVLEKLAVPGGSMRLSSGVIWRHRDFDTFRRECPDGDERLQRLIFERLDADLDWLESLGAPVRKRDLLEPDPAHHAAHEAELLAHGHQLVDDAPIHEAEVPGVDGDVDAGRALQHGQPAL